MKNYNANIDYQDETYRKMLCALEDSSIDKSNPQVSIIPINGAVVVLPHTKESYTEDNIGSILSKLIAPYVKRSDYLLLNESSSMDILALTPDQVRLLEWLQNEGIFRSHYYFDEMKNLKREEI